MKKTLNQTLAKCAKIGTAVAVVANIFSACSKSSNTVNTGPQLPAEAIRGTVLNKGNYKGVLLSDSTYTVNGDISVLPTDTLTIQPGCTIKMTGNYAFLVQGIIQALGTQAKPIVITSTVSQTPGQWRGMQCDSAVAVTFYWTKFLWAGGPDLSGGGTTQTISVSKPNIPVDIEDCWFVGGQDNSIGVYNTDPVKILRNSAYGNGTSDGDIVDFHSGVSGVVAYNVIWGSAGSAIKIFTTSGTLVTATNCSVYNNTCIESGFRRGAGEPGRGVLVDAGSIARVYNNLLVNNYWSLDLTPSSNYAQSKYGNNYFYVTVDSLRQFMYPAPPELGMIQTSDIIDSVHLGANDPKFVGYTVPPNPSNRIIPTNFDFHLQSGSPALGKGFTGSIALPPMLSGATGIPGPSSDIGAYVTDTSGGKGNRHAAGY
jgi:hypothetical protein